MASTLFKILYISCTFSNITIPFISATFVVLHWRNVFFFFHMVHGETKYEWHTGDIRLHTNDIQVHTSDIPMIQEYIRVTYGWNTSTCEWHTDDIRVAYGWHTSTYEWHTDGMSIYEWHTDDIRVCLSDIRMTYEYILFWAIYQNWKGSGINFWCTLSAWVFHTNAPYLILYQLTNVLLSSSLHNWDVINFKFYLQSSSKKTAEGGGMRGSQKYKNLKVH